MAGATHEQNIKLTKTIQPAPPEKVGFGIMAYMSDGSTLGGDTARTYTPDSDLDADVAAGELTQKAADDLNDAFAQTPTPSPILVIGVDTTGGETYAGQFNAAVNEGFNFYGVAPDTRTDTEIEALASAVESDGEHIMAGQSSSTDWLTSGVPAAYTSVENNLRGGIMYHPTDGEPSELAWMASRLAFSPDNTSAPFTGSLVNIAGYPDGSGITVGERTQIEDNGANSLLPYGSSSTYVDPGQNLAGNPFYEIVTIDWFAARLKSKFLSLKQSYDARGEKLGVDPSGQAAVVGEIESQINTGIELGHLADERADGVNDVTAPDPIPDADVQSQTIRAQASLKFKTSGRIFDVTLNFQRV